MQIDWRAQLKIHWLAGMPDPHMGVSSRKLAVNTRQQIGHDRVKVAGLLRAHFDPVKKSLKALVLSLSDSPGCSYNPIDCIQSLSLSRNSHVRNEDSHEESISWKTQKEVDLAR